jgi:glycosyltransferase involved in cell wall biosynthesis
MAFFFLAWWRAFWVKKIFRDVDFFIAPSQFLLEKYLQNGIARGKILFIRHGFHQTHLHGIQKTASPKMRFAFVGTMRYHKGIYVLIDAFNKITGDAELKIYGRITPALRDDLTKRIDNPDILIMGELKEEDKRKAFEEIDVLIVPSICYENCPLVINEAFMAKIPVITSNLGGMAELVKDGEYGFTFPVGDSEQLANKIQLFIKNPALKNHLSAKLPDVKDIQTHTEEIFQLYNRLKENQIGY